MSRRKPLKVSKKQKNEDLLSLSNHNERKIVPYKPHSGTKSVSKKQTSVVSNKDNIVLLDQFRERKVQSERRKAQRVVLDEVFPAFIVMEDGLHRIRIRDLTEDGLGIEWPQWEGILKTHETITIRIYLNRMIYFRIKGEVVRSQSFDTEKVIVFGIKVKHSESDAAYIPFVAFLRTLVASLRKDSGDLVSGTELS